MHSENETFLIMQVETFVVQLRKQICVPQYNESMTLLAKRKSFEHFPPKCRAYTRVLLRQHLQDPVAADRMPV